MEIKLIKIIALVLVGMLALSSILPALAAPGDIILVSKDSLGVQGNQDSYATAVSADGRFVAYFSTATNLAIGCNNGKSHIYVHDQASGKTKCVSVSTYGVQGNDESASPSISADGRYVAFASRATNLVDADTNGKVDIFVHDMKTNETIRISVSHLNKEAPDGVSVLPVISANGRYVAFMSDSEKLVPNDTNGMSDVFVRDLQNRTTACITCVIGSTPSNGRSGWPSISADGQRIAFESNATNLVSGDSNGKYDIFVHNLTKGTNTLVSVSTDGAQGKNDSEVASISADGRYVAFSSLAHNLVPDDENGVRDIFVRDLVAKTTTRVSVSSDGEEGDKRSDYPSISENGRFVTFESDATNLDPVDNNDMTDVFVHDLTPGETKLISLALDGRPGDGWSIRPIISANSRFVAFTSEATNLVVDHHLNYDDAFVWQNDLLGSMTFLPLIVR